jgi:hypothetical protein
MESLLAGESRGEWGRAVARHNPFYLLSAFSMLLGCWILSRALALEPGHAGKLVVLIGVLNLYEAMLIGLALFLIVRRGLVRDGRMLLWVESVFLVDATFLGSELYASDLRLGGLLALGLFLLAGLKVAAIVRGLGVRFDPAVWIGLVPVGVLLAIPGVLAALAQAHLLSLPVVYVLWWLVALLVIAQAVVERERPAGAATSSPEEAAAALRRALGVLPCASLAIHLIGAGWVQGVRFDVSLLGPVFLALGLRSLLRDVASAPGRGSLGWPAAAILVSIGAPQGLVVVGLSGFPLSRLRVMLVAAALAYLLALRIHKTPVFAWGAGLCLLGAGAGHTVGAMASTFTSLARTVFSWSGRLVPRTAGQWGAFTVGLSFVLLALGARKSLLRPDSPEPNGRESGEPANLATALQDPSEL